MLNVGWLWVWLWLLWCPLSQTESTFTYYEEEAAPEQVDVTQVTDIADIAKFFSKR
jgi:hypothetical protein